MNITCWVVIKSQNPYNKTGEIYNFKCYILQKYKYNYNMHLKL